MDDYYNTMVPVTRYTCTYVRTIMVRTYVRYTCTYTVYCNTIVPTRVRTMVLEYHGVCVRIHTSWAAKLLALCLNFLEKH